MGPCFELLTLLEPPNPNIIDTIISNHTAGKITLSHFIDYLKITTEVSLLCFKNQTRKNYV